MPTAKQMGSLMGATLVTSTIRSDNENVLWTCLGKVMTEKSTEKSRDEFMSEMVNAIMTILVGDDKSKIAMVNNFCEMIKVSCSAVANGAKTGKKNLMEDKVVSDAASEVVADLSDMLTSPALKELQDDYEEEDEEPSKSKGSVIDELAKEKGLKR